ILLQFEGLEIHILALIWDCNPRVQGARLFSRLRIAKEYQYLRNMVTRTWDNSPTKARPARHCPHTPAVLAKKSYMSGFGFHSRCSNCNSRDLNQLRHAIRLKFQTGMPK
ncbi:hypothetical protein U9M48_021617, partial [Paspalum notatum var. saurae]